MRYTIIKKGTTKKEMMEKTFCFACGCFQGGVVKPKKVAV